MDLAIKKAKEHGVGWVVCKGLLTMKVIYFLSLHLARIDVKTIKIRNFPLRTLGSSG